MMRNLSKFGSSPTILSISIICAIYFIQYYFSPIILNIRPYSSEWISLFTISRENISVSSVILSWFSHGGVPHILNNIFSLLIVGYVFEKTYSSKKFWISVIVCGILSSAGMIFTYVYFEMNSTMLGTSGIILGLGGVLVSTIPYQRSIPIRYSYVNVLFVTGWISCIVIVLISVFITVSIHPSYMNLGHMAHVSGLISGIILGQIYSKKYSINPNTINQYIDNMYTNIEKYVERYFEKIY